jgi:hypothetical protein
MSHHIHAVHTAMLALDRAVRDLSPGATRTTLEARIADLLLALDRHSRNELGEVLRRDRAGVWPS